MNIGKSSEVSSSGGREDGAAPSDERPHKKARFAWQIKGKYHLKNKTNHSIESSAMNTLTGSEILKPPADVTHPQTVIPLLEIDSNTSLINDVTNTQNQDFNAISGSSTSMTSSPDMLKTNIPITQSSETMTTSPEVNSINICSENSRPSSIRRPISPREAQRLRREEDRCISQWQATQTVKGCFDNTINRVLESWMNAPAPTEERFLTLDFAQFMNHLPPADDNIENEGILMAISAHGLQSVPTAQCSQPVTSNIPKRDDDSDSSLSSSDFEMPSQQKSPSPSPSSSNEHMTHYPYEQSADESNNLESPWVQNTNEVPFAIPPDPFQYFGNNSTADDYNDDFMNTAVLHAIQSKGLVASGTDFG